MHKFIPLAAFLNRVAPTVNPATYQPSGKPLPQSADTSSNFGSIENQLDLGSCTAFAGTQLYSEWLVRQGQKWMEFSELAQYWEERDIMGTVSQDSGAFGAQVIDVLCGLGVQVEKDDPYQTTEFQKQPNESYFANPVPLDCVRQVNKSTMLNDTLDALANGLPVMFGFTVFQEMESQQVAQSGILPMPANPNNAIGGHEVVAVGFDASKQMIKVRNQWGVDWGQQGSFWMPYAFYSQYTDIGYLLLKPSSPIDFKPWPSPAPKPKPQPKEAYYELTVGPADNATTQKIENFCSGLHVGVVRKQVH